MSKSSSHYQVSHQSPTWDHKHTSSESSIHLTIIHCLYTIKNWFSFATCTKCIHVLDVNVNTFVSKIVIKSVLYTSCNLHAYNVIDLIIICGDFNICIHKLCLSYSLFNSCNDNVELSTWSDSVSIFTRNLSHFNISTI